MIRLLETADSYAWTFGDGTTSTLKDPVKTYASYGTYTVTLAVTNGGVVTRTTTEPVIVQALVT
jgi:PKD repeat protein